jgi:hypothetical protein
MLFVPLLSPQGWDYVLLLATPAVVCLVDRWSEMSVGWRVIVGLALALMGLTVFDVMGRDLYARFGQLLRAEFPGWQLAILSANRRLEQELRLRLEERLHTRNGGIPVGLLTGRVPESSEH